MNIIEYRFMLSSTTEGYRGNVSNKQMQSRYRPGVAQRVPGS